MASPASPTLFCCSGVQPYKERRLDLEPYFTGFLEWARTGHLSASNAPPDACIIQLVRQKNFGPLQSVHFFKYEPGSSGFSDSSQEEVIRSNYHKKNAFKNFRCSAHDLFFELNLYHRDPHSQHHWRMDVERPFDKIDVGGQQQQQQ